MPRADDETARRLLEMFGDRPLFYCHLPSFQRTWRLLGQFHLRYPNMFIQIPADDRTNRRSDGWRNRLFPYQWEFTIAIPGRIQIGSNIPFADVTRYSKKLALFPKIPLLTPAIKVENPSISTTQESRKNPEELLQIPSCYNLKIPN